MIDLRGLKVVGSHNSKQHHHCVFFERYIKIIEITLGHDKPSNVKAVMKIKIFDYSTEYSAQTSGLKRSFVYVRLMGKT